MGILTWVAGLMSKTLLSLPESMRAHSRRDYWSQQRVVDSYILTSGSNLHRSLPNVLNTFSSLHSLWLPSWKGMRLTQLHVCQPRVREVYDLTGENQNQNSHGQLAILMVRLIMAYKLVGISLVSNSLRAFRKKYPEKPDHSILTWLLQF